MLPLETSITTFIMQEENIVNSQVQTQISPETKVTFFHLGEVLQEQTLQA